MGGAFYESPQSVAGLPHEVSHKIAAPCAPVCVGGGGTGLQGEASRKGTAGQRRPEEAGGGG
eukprot:349688-Chlamydomonas_euryale.AAC.2